MPMQRTGLALMPGALTDRFYLSKLAPSALRCDTLTTHPVVGAKRCNWLGLDPRDGVLELWVYAHLLHPAHGNNRTQPRYFNIPR